MAKIKEYVFKKKPEQKLKEKEEIVINKEEEKEKEKKITINPNKIHNEKLKSFYENKVILYNCLGIFFLVFGLFIIVNTIFYIFDSQTFNLFIRKDKSLWFNIFFGFVIGLMTIRLGANTCNKKVKKYEKLLRELKE